MKQFLFSAAVLITVNIFAQGYTPAVKLTAGEKYTVITTTKGNMSQEVMGQTMEIPMDITINSLLEVKAASDAGCQLSTANNHIVLSMSMMGQDINYDSDKKEDRDGQLGGTMGDMLNKSTAFNINKFGKIDESSIVKPARDKNDAASANPILGMINMGDADVPSPAVDLFKTDTEIKVGDSFTDSSTSADGKDKKSMTYTLAEVKDGAAKFTVAGSSALTKEMEMQGMQTTSVTNTKITGEMWVNAVNGLLAKKVLNMAITGSVEVAGMNIPVSGSNTITITVAEAGK